MLDPFIATAWLAGLGIALMSAPIGCFIAWQRLVYFGDTVAHASLLGVVLALVMGTSPVAGIMLVAVIVALVVATFHHDYLLPSDTLLGIIAHASLALGLVILSQSTITLDVNGLLFGDILAASRQDVAFIMTAAFASLTIIIHQWKALMRFVLHPDIAEVEGGNTRRTRLLLMLLIAVMVAISIKLVGILLITSLLILPAASARLLATSPGGMIVAAIAASMLSVTVGLFASLQWDTPTGPTIILSALALLVLLALARRR